MKLSKQAEEALKKVKKLLNLAKEENNDKQGERSNALEAAHKIMNQYKLDISEINLDAEDSDQLAVDGEIIETALDKWTRTVWSAVAKRFDCTLLIANRKSKQYPMIVGLPANIETVKLLAVWCVKSIRTEANLYSKSDFEIKQKILKQFGLKPENAKEVFGFDMGKSRSQIFLSFCHGASRVILIRSIEIERQQEIESRAAKAQMEANSNEPAEPDTQLAVMNESLKEKNKEFVESLNVGPPQQTRNLNSNTIDTKAFQKGGALGDNLSSRLVRQISDKSKMPATPLIGS